MRVLALVFTCLVHAVFANIAITATSIQKLDGKLSSVKPPVKTPPDPEAYLGVMSCLGYFGPMGLVASFFFLRLILLFRPYGPLGLLGPVGSNMWNPSYWISAIGDWSEWSSSLTNLKGPLSEAGPLGLLYFKFFIIYCRRPKRSSEQ